MGIILQQNFCYDVNERFGTTWMVTLYSSIPNPLQHPAWENVFAARSKRHQNSLPPFNSIASFLSPFLPHSQARTLCVLLPTRWTIFLLSLINLMYCWAYIISCNSAKGVKSLGIGIDPTLVLRGWERMHEQAKFVGLECCLECMCTLLLIGAGKKLV